MNAGPTSAAPRRSLKHAVIVCHPFEQSFNLAVAQAYSETVRELGHEVVLRDLYRMDFDPVLKASEIPSAENFVIADDVAAELDLLSGVDLLVFIYPIWFGTPPALLKGYVERVLGAGFTHGAVRDRSPHALSGRAMLSFTSSANSRPWLDEQGAVHALETVFDDYLRHAFSLCHSEHVHFASVVGGLSERYVQENLFEVREVARRFCTRIGEIHASDAR